MNVYSWCHLDAAITMGFFLLFNCILGMRWLVFYRLITNKLFVLPSDYVITNQLYFVMRIDSLAPHVYGMCIYTEVVFNSITDITETFIQIHHITNNWNPWADRVIICHKYKVTANIACICLNKTAVRSGPLYPDSKVHVAPGGPHVGPMNLAIKVGKYSEVQGYEWWDVTR